MPPIGRTISHYTILEKLGEGGMGEVYKARDTKLGRLVALKFLPPSLNSPLDVQRFQQEAKSISALNHPNIATIHDIDHSDGSRFLVLEYLSGGTLNARIRHLASSGRDHPLQEILGYGIQIAGGLAHAHRNGIIHRDIKTENMMLTGEGTLKITDFGLAKLRGGAPLTRSGTTVGTASYMSPEQIRGEALDQRSDLFSFGVVLYELATGTLPFRGDHEAAVTYATVNEDPIPLTSIRSSIPASFERIVRRCLEKDRLRRYQSAEEIIEDLRSLQSGASIETTAARSRARTPWIAAGSIGVLLLIAGLVLWSRSSPSGDRKSIAVLPFKNMTDARENEFFSDGVTEDIIARLSKIGDLKVISRTSVMQYKNSTKSIKEIAAELNVVTVLEGSVRKADNEIRIVAQLIDARNDEHLWAETYDRELTQIFAIQTDVANRIAGALQARLSPSERERLGVNGTNNLQAYNAYLKAQFLWNKITKEDLRSAIAFYNEAIRNDGAYARAYAGLAIAYSLTAFFSFDFIPREEAVANARGAVLKALDLDPNLAEAHSALAYILRTFDWNFAGAEEEFRKSIALDPNYSIARDFYSLLLAGLSRFDEAVKQSDRAAELDPLSIEILNSHARVYYYAGRYDEAIGLARREFEVEPDSRPAHGLLGSIYEMKRMNKEALAEITLARSISGTDYEGYSRTSDSTASTDWDTYWARRYAIADEMCRQNRLPHIVLAIVALRAGKREQAIESLQEAYRMREGSLVYLNVEPHFEPLRNDPRVIAILNNMKFR
jgi:serine/threonine protein kinase/Tfp pilus assembly protein PilF